MKRATGAKAASLRADAACSMSVCRARRRPGSPGSTPATWLSSKITRSKATSFSRRRPSSRWCSKPACSCSKAAHSSSRTSKFASRSSCPIRRRACSSSFPTTERAHVRDPEPLRAKRRLVAACRRLDARRAHGIRLRLLDVGAGARTLEPVAGRGLLPLHERSRAALRRGIPAHPRTLRRRRANRRAASLCPRRSPPRGRICAASGALRRRAADLLRRRRDRRGSPLADETAGAFCAHPFPPLARRIQPRARRACCECNDEFVEGDIALYDEAGKPCVLVDGFRAISVSGARRSGARRHARCDLSRRLGAHAFDRVRPALAAAAAGSTCTPPPRARWIEVIAMRGRAET